MDISILSAKFDFILQTSQQTHKMSSALSRAVLEQSEQMYELSRRNMELLKSLEKKHEAEIANEERIALKYENRSDDLYEEVNRLREMVKVLTLESISSKEIYETPLLLNFWDKESGEMFGDIIDEMNDENWNEDNGNCELKWSGESIGRLSAEFKE